MYTHLETKMSYIIVTITMTEERDVPIMTQERYLKFQWKGTTTGLDKKPNS